MLAEKNIFVGPVRDMAAITSVDDVLLGLRKKEHHTHANNDTKLKSEVWKHFQ